MKITSLQERPGKVFSRSYCGPDGAVRDYNDEGIDQGRFAFPRRIHTI